MIGCEFEHILFPERTLYSIGFVRFLTMKLFSKKNFPCLEFEDKEAKKKIQEAKKKIEEAKIRIEEEAKKRIEEEAKKRKKEKNLRNGFLFCFFMVCSAIL